MKFLPDEEAASYGPSKAQAGAFDKLQTKLRATQETTPCRSGSRTVQRIDLSSHEVLSIMDQLVAGDPSEASKSSTDTDGDLPSRSKMRPLHNSSEHSTPRRRRDIQSRQGSRRRMLKESQQGSRRSVGSESLQGSKRSLGSDVPPPPPVASPSLTPKDRRSGSRESRRNRARSRSRAPGSIHSTASDEKSAENVTPSRARRGMIRVSSSEEGMPDRARRSRSKSSDRSTAKMESSSNRSFARRGKKHLQVRDSESLSSRNLSATKDLRGRERSKDSQARARSQDPTMRKSRDPSHVETKRAHRKERRSSSVAPQHGASDNRGDERRRRSRSKSSDPLSHRKSSDSGHSPHRQRRRSKSILRHTSLESEQQNRRSKARPSRARSVDASRKVERSISDGQSHTSPTKYRSNDINHSQQSKQPIRRGRRDGTEVAQEEHKGRRKIRSKSRDLSRSGNVRMGLSDHNSSEFESKKTLSLSSHARCTAPALSRANSETNVGFDVVKPRNASSKWSQLKSRSTASTGKAKEPEEVVAVSTFATSGDRWGTSALNMVPESSKPLVSPVRTTGRPAVLDRKSVMKPENMMSFASLSDWDVDD